MKRRLEDSATGVGMKKRWQKLLRNFRVQFDVELKFCVMHGFFFSACRLVGKDFGKGRRR